METITHMIAYCGFPAGTNALLTAKDVFQEFDAQAARGRWRSHSLGAAASRVMPVG